VLSSTINSPVGVACPVGHVVLDDPDQIAAGGVEILTGPGRGDDPLAAHPAQLRVDHDREVSPI
jgi:hypothetical protein